MFIYIQPMGEKDYVLKAKNVFSIKNIIDFITITVDKFQRKIILSINFYALS